MGTDGQLVGGAALSRLFDDLGSIPDPRKRRGVRHSCAAQLRLLVLGFAFRLVSLEGIALMARVHWRRVGPLVGDDRDEAPDATTLGRLTKRVSVRELSRVFADWARTLVSGSFRASVDGKVSALAAGPDGRPLLVVEVFAADVAQCLAPWPVEPGAGEPTTLAPRLSELFDKYPGLRLLTADAGYAGRSLCGAIVKLGRDYLVQVKGNQPEALEALREHFEAPAERQRKPDAAAVGKKGAPSRSGGCGSKRGSSRGTCARSSASPASRRSERSCGRAGSGARTVAKAARRRRPTG